MTKASDAQAVRDAWLKAFREQDLSAKRGFIPDDFWEGAIAYDELRQCDMLGQVYPGKGDMDYLFPFLMDRLFWELEQYRRYSGRVVPINEEFRDALELLDASAMKLSKRIPRKRYPQLRRILATCAQSLEKGAAQARREQMAFWQRTVDKYDTDPEAIIVLDPDHDYKTELTRHEKMFEKSLHPKKLTKNIDLDARLQIRLGAILRHYLLRKIEVTIDLTVKRGKLVHRTVTKKGLSLMTICRLVVLYYICAELTEEVNDKLKIRQSNRELTLGGVYQRLRDAGLR